MNFIIESRHREYLFGQCGDIAHLEGEEWTKGYAARIEAQFDSIKPILPEKLVNSLDIGGGLSGISARLGRHYGRWYIPAVMDGRNDSAAVSVNYKTHNHATVTQNFLLKNGILNQLYYTPDDADWGGSWYDLVMSFQSWCFHYEPGVYLSQVLKCTQNGSIVVVDVRKSKPEWKQTMLDAFGNGRILTVAKKWERIAFLRWDK